MNLSVVLAHPSAGSFNRAVAETAVSELRLNGHTVTFQDLYTEGFDPILPGPETASGAALPPSVAAHCREIAAAEGIVIVHPNWWGQPPAILKGWLDRVIGISNTPAEREQAVFGDPPGVDLEEMRLRSLRSETRSPWY